MDSNDTLGGRRQLTALLTELGEHVGPYARAAEHTAPRACPVCGTDEPGAPVISAPVYAFHRCRTCSLLYAPRLLRPEVTRKLYAERPIYKTYWERTLAEAEGQRGRPVHGALVERLLMRVARRGTVVDVGCGFGKLLSELRPHFAEGIGLELNRRTAQTGEKLFGVPIKPVRLEKLDRPAGSVDLILMSGVLEHLAEVRATIAAAHRLLAPGGVLYVSSPHGESAGLRLAGASHPIVSTHLTINLFTAPALRRLVADAGFALELVGTDGAMGVHLGGSRFGFLSERLLTKIAAPLGRFVADLWAGAHIEAMLRRPAAAAVADAKEDLLAAV